MNYGQLKAAIIDESLRSDLTAQIPLFIRRGEGMISRDLRASEMLTLLSLTDAERVAADSAQYHLPDDFLEDRNVICNGYALRKTSLSGLQRVSGGAPPQIFTINADVALGNLIEFRGTPSTDQVVLVDYFARPKTLVADTDTTRLLTNHPSIYIDSALFSLYKFTQDLELAQAALDTWSNAKNTLNEQASRFLAGSNAAPKYNIGRFTVGGRF